MRSFQMSAAKGDVVTLIGSDYGEIEEALYSLQRSKIGSVANLWTEFSAQRRHWLIANGKEPQNPNELVVAATFEMAKT